MSRTDSETQFLLGVAQHPADRLVRPQKLLGIQVGDQQPIDHPAIDGLQFLTLKFRLVAWDTQGNRHCLVRDCRWRTTLPRQSGLPPSPVRVRLYQALVPYAGASL